MSDAAPPDDDRSYDDLVEEAAYMLYHSLVDSDDVRPPERFRDAGHTADELLSDAREWLEDHDVERDRIEQTTTSETTGSVDWPALWAEFGFDSPNAIGSHVVSTTQLRGALSCTDQPITGDPDALIAGAVENHTLVPQRTYDESGIQCLRGYVLVEGSHGD